MGLTTKPHLTEDQLRRIYITVIRQNWHVLPDDQLMELLGWDPQHYEYTLKEDDFLWIKLGLLRPRCGRLRYEEPSAAIGKLDQPLFPWPSPGLPALLAADRGGSDCGGDTDFQGRRASEQ